MSATGYFGRCCCEVPEERDSKLLAVAAPFFNFFAPFTDGGDDENRYLVRTHVWTNSTGSRTTVVTHDDDCGSVNEQVTDSPGYDNGVSVGTQTGHTVTELVDTTTYTLGSSVYTLSSPVTYADQAAKSQTALDALLDTWDAKTPLGITAYEDLGFGLEEVLVGWLFRSEAADYATILPGSIYGSSRILLTPDTTAFPWNGRYVISLPDYGTDWYYASYGWPGRGDIATSRINSLTLVAVDGSDPADWAAGPGNVIASKSCHALTDGIGCTSGGPLDLVHGIIDRDTELVSSTSACAGLELNAGFYCFGRDGIFRPANSTPIAASYAMITESGWFLADETGNGQGNVLGGPNYGPIWWAVDCCP